MLKCTVNTKDFQDALKKLDKIMIKNSSLKILEGMKLAVNNHSIELTASDLENYVTASMTTDKVEETGETVISNIKEIIKSFKYMKETFTNLEVSKDIIIIKNGNKDIKLKAYEAENFPKPIDINKITNRYDYNTKDLYNRIKKVDYAVGKDKARLPLTGIYFNGSDIVALDGYRMALSKDYKLFINSPLLIQSSAIDFLTKTINKKKEDRIKISNDKEYTIFEYDNIKLITKLIDGKYFDYQKIFPETFDLQASVYTEDFKENTEFLQIYAKNNKNNVVGLEIAKDYKIISTVKNQEGKFTTETSTNINQEYKIFYNNQFMVDVLKVIDVGDIKLKFNSNISPIIIESGDDQHLILPIREPN